MMQEAIIETPADFRQAVDTIASLAEEAKELKSRAKRLVDLAEAYAKANAEQVFPDGRLAGETDFARYELAADAPALKRLPGVSEADVVRMLGENGETAKFVKHTFDAPEIKLAFASSKVKRQKVRKFGLFFTETALHLKVEAKLG